MTIYQLKDRCWEVQPPLDEDRSPHYDTEDGAREAVEDATDEAGDVDPATRPVQLAAPCWVVRCDGGCELLIDQEDEGYVFHHDSRAEAEQSMVPFRWVFGDDGRIFCEEDAPPGSVPAYPSPAELEAAGQLRLPGVA